MTSEAQFIVSCSLFVMDQHKNGFASDCQMAVFSPRLTGGHVPIERVQAPRRCQRYCLKGAGFSHCITVSSLGSFDADSGEVMAGVESKMHACSSPARASSTEEFSEFSFVWFFHLFSSFRCLHIDYSVCASIPS